MSRSVLANVLGLAGLVLFASFLSAQPTPAVGSSKWQFDEITLKNGAKFKGLLIAELKEGIQFQAVYQLPGRPTVTLTSYFNNSEISNIKVLSKEDREILKEKLAELDPSGEGERKRMDSLELIAADWPGKKDGARLYESEHFHLVCTGSEELTRRAAVRLEQIYTAFTRFLPPTQPHSRPTVFMLATNPDEYKMLLGPLIEPNLLNPAVYDPNNNRILCGSELTRLGEELQAARVYHAQQIAGIERYELNLKKLYKGEELVRHLKTTAAERKRVYLADGNNGTKFDQATSRLFAILYHEAFHAYVETFVFPTMKPEDVKAGKGTGEIPRWLNEGMAQIFETAVVEAGELRVDHPDKERLRKCKELLRGNGGTSLIPLGDLLQVGGDAFIAAHADEKTASDRAYLTSWSLVYYLIFERRVIGTDAFRKYLKEINSGGNPKKAFAVLVGQELQEFEKDWHGYIKRLQPNGALVK